MTTASLPSVFAAALAALSGAAVAEPVDFSHQIVPILRQHCVECHGGTKAEGGFSINTRVSFLDDERAVPGSGEKRTRDRSRFPRSPPSSAPS